MHPDNPPITFAGFKTVSHRAGLNATQLRRDRLLFAAGAVWWSVTRCPPSGVTAAVRVCGVAGCPGAGGPAERGVVRECLTGR